MKYPSRKKSSRPKKSNKNPRASNGDSSFEPDLKRLRRRIESNDEDLESLPSDEEERVEDGDGDEEPVETAAEVKYRIASEHLEKIRAAAQRVEEEEDEGEDREEAEGARDSLIADILQKSQLEESGRVRRLLASR